MPSTTMPYIQSAASISFLFYGSKIHARPKNGNNIDKGFVERDI
jgi:hypothetical protein